MTGDNDNSIYEREATRKVPRWVTILVIVLAVIGLMFIVMLLVGGTGGHGPGRHLGTGPDAGAAIAVPGTGDAR